MPLDDAGFEVVASVLTADETESLLAALATVPRGRAGARNLLTLDAVARIADDKRVSGLAQAALEAPAIPFKATLFDKTPAANWLVAWHQDTALPLESRRDAPGWIASRRRPVAVLAVGARLT